QCRRVQPVPLLCLGRGQASGGAARTAGWRLDRARQINAAKIGVELSHKRSERTNRLVVGKSTDRSVMDPCAELHIVAALYPAQVAIPLVEPAIPELLP